MRSQGKYARSGGLSLLALFCPGIGENVKSNYDDAILDGDKPPHHGLFPAIDNCPTTKAGAGPPAYIVSPQNTATPRLEQA
jgi:hypothetical protein